MAPVKSLLLVWSICFFLWSKCHAQKVGLVLSGGGADALAHIGVLKALEEDSISVDYICGSSMGALLSAFYASGYSSKDLEFLVKSYFFEGLAKGKIPLKYDYLIKRTEDYGAWFSLKINSSEPTLKNIPSNLINSSPIDFYLMETFSPASFKSFFNFDSLYIPLRIVASDVEQKKIHVFKNGNLQDAVRSSITYPFYIRPIAPFGQLLFDGGLYNNFPIELMRREFHPDLIIGSTTAETKQKPDEENVYSQIRTFLTQNLDSVKTGSNTYIIQPHSKVGTFNLSNIPALIDSGYRAAKRILQTVKKNHVLNPSNRPKKQAKQSIFYNYNLFSGLKLDTLSYSGFNFKQQFFLNHHLSTLKFPVNYQTFRKRYFRLLNDEFFRYLYPNLNLINNRVNLNITGKSQRPFQIEPGAIISNKPITETFLGLRYMYFGRSRISAYANGYFGKLTSGTHLKLKWEPPTRIPLFLEPSLTYANWDYYNSSALFYDFQKPSYLLQIDRYVTLRLGLPVGNQSLLSAQYGFADWESRYYTNDAFDKIDTSEFSQFVFQHWQSEFTSQTLNRKMYSSEGYQIKLRLKLISGTEYYIPGTQSKAMEPSDSVHKPWFQFKYTGERYFKTFSRLKLGVYSELLISNQPVFKNYKSSMLASPAFQPTPESQTLVMPDFRSHNYAALGFKSIFNPANQIDLRTEVYLFQPYQRITNKNNTVQLSDPFLYRSITASMSLVYNSPVGPVSLGINYYEKQEQPVSLFFHLGYIIFNAKSLD